MTTHLRSFQEPGVRAVTQQQGIGLIALLAIMTSWADTSLPYGLVKGLPAVGYAPEYGIFPSQPATPLTMADVLEGWQEHNSHILKSLKPGKDDALLLEQSAADATQGFCTPPTRPGILGVRAEQEQLGMTSVGWGSTILGGNPTGSALVSQACRL